MLYEKEFNSLLTISESIEKPTVVMVEGNYGSGKSYLINNVIKKSGLPYIKVKQDGEGLLFQSLAEALEEFAEQNTLQSQFNDQLPYKVNLKKELLEICVASHSMIVWVEDLSEISKLSETIFLVIETIDYLNQLNSTAKVLFIFENSVDKSLASVPAIVYKVKQKAAAKIMLKAEYTIELKEYFASLFSYPVQIKPNELERLLEACFYNPFFIYCVVEYLKDNYFFY